MPGKSKHGPPPGRTSRGARLLITWRINCHEIMESHRGVRHMSDCCICASLISAHSSEVWNKAILESDHFVVLPSLGSLVPGWVLVTPKHHYLCIGALPQNLLPEFQRVKEETVGLIASQFGEPCIFEHGPSSAGLKVG